MDNQEKRTFAEQGYVVLRGRVAPDLMAGVDQAVERSLAESKLSSERSGLFSTRLLPDEAPEVFTALHDSSVWAELHEFVAPAALEHFDGRTQLALNIPPNHSEPGGPHVDHHTGNGDRPNSFTFLAAIFVTDQEAPGEGNVIVWPGTHLLHGEYLEAYGPGALMAGSGKLKNVAPAVQLPRPVSVCGRRGDVYLAHPLLGHESGPHYGENTRKAIYFRLRRSDHEARWAECVTNPLLEYNLDN